MAREYPREAGEGALISPGAKDTGVKGLYGEGAVKLSVAAPPERGRSNAEAARLPAGPLGVGLPQAEVVRGAADRDKVVLARGVDAGGAGRTLDGILGG